MDIAVRRSRQEVVKIVLSPHGWLGCCALTQVKYISDLEERRNSLLAKLPADIISKVLSRQREAMEVPGECLYSSQTSSRTLL